jgi:hypothetical protein
MKELYMHIMHVNDGIPEDMTIADMRRMEELKIYQWEEYERKQEKLRLQHYQSKNSGEIAKTEQAEQYFKAALEEATKKERS